MTTGRWNCVNYGGSGGDGPERVLRFDKVSSTDGGRCQGGPGYGVMARGGGRGSRRCGGGFGRGGGDGPEPAVGFGA